MPKDKKRPPSDSESDSGPEDRGPAKKSKPGAASKSSGAAKQEKSDSQLSGQDPSWHLGRNKHVVVRSFKGQTYIDIREYYVDKNTMDTKPGKKGISLNCEQYQKLKTILDEIDHALP
uniref:Activated RNA polymerase II transcriptional coactivator p15 n=1 Tax=Acartia pacifica TaxID=335913 RepID=A0A0U2TG75_ACAPC|nr:activated RNA polymerase II transcriptional coactivator p15 [Acartia pacifica]